MQHLDAERVRRDKIGGKAAVLLGCVSDGKAQLAVLISKEATGQIKAGDTVPITLVFEGADKKRETVEVKAPARALNEHAGMENMKH